MGKSLIASVCRKKRKEVYDPTVLKKPKGGSLRSVVLKTTLAGFVEDKGLYVEIKARKPSRLSLVLFFFNIFVNRKNEAIVVKPAKGLKKKMKALKEHCCRDNESVSKEKLSMLK